MLINGCSGPPEKTEKPGGGKTGNDDDTAAMDGEDVTADGTTDNDGAAADEKMSVDNGEKSVCCHKPAHTGKQHRIG